MPRPFPDAEPGRPRPLVSVITIFLNAENFLQEALDSLFAQTYQAWELSLVDDGSCDGSSERARRCAARHPDRVRYLEHRDHVNRGMGASRNLGLRHSRGTYVAFLDADDVWLPDKLEQQVAILEAAPDAAMVQGAPLFWRSWMSPAEHLLADTVALLPAPAGSLVQPPLLLASMLSGTAPSPWPSDVLVRREAVLAVGGFEDAFRGQYEDQAFFAKLLLRRATFVSGESWLRYRMHGDSSCAVSERAEGRDAGRLFFLSWLKGYFARHAPVDRGITRLLEEQLRPYRLATRIRKRIRRLGRKVIVSVQGARGFWLWSD